MDKYPIEVVEKRAVKRITLRQSLADFLDAFNVERGLIYTVKLLFTQPGQLIRYYLEDGRFKIVNAFRLLLITTAISLIFLSVTDSFQIFYTAEAESEELTDAITGRIESVFSEWYNLILWLSIPCYALSSFLFLRKYEAFNYAEHLVIQSFFISLSNILIIVCLPFGYLIGFKVAFAISFLIGVGYFLFFFSKLFQRRSFWFFIRVLIAFIFGNVFYYIILGFGLFFIMYQFMAGQQ